MPSSTPPQVRISSSQSALRVPRKKAVELIDYVARGEGVRVAEVDLAVVDADEVASVNRQWVGHAGPTDVISFDLSDERSEGLWAQLVICGPMAVRQARAHNQGVQREFLLYVVHGLLHLLGYDDQNPRAAAAMHARQEELLDAYLAGDPPPGAV